ncbi:hypothetical protein Poly51_23210 [Rubripirellula tenax]|uniref:Uncharacterized protein n=1 Tax=Rubripirellula tenax TaxID=2528015 RepID=A0A5C6FA40_9BACT|nr:hypothetical protein [Rubripirellula tenax]TWU56411.1 hypothetical protein Poly51_23210 [Rubripirellula tenax]
MRFLLSLASLLAILLTLLSSPLATAAEPAEATKVTVFGDGDLDVPAEFKSVDPKSRIIEHEFEATADGAPAPARITMMAAGGDVPANIARWKGQFAGGNADANKTETMKVGQWEVHLVDLNGSFGESMGGGPFSGGKVVQREDYAMTAAILVHPEGQKYFVKMIGPAAVIKANREKFVAMIKSIE